MKKILFTLFLIVSISALSSCGESKVEYYECYGHTYEYIITEENHQKHYTCLCEDEEVEAHFDNDSDGLCDICAFEMPQEEVFELQKTYYLPYKNVVCPITITFNEDIGRCSYTFKNERTTSETHVYQVIDDYVYIYFGSSEKYCAFKITQNSIVYDKEKSTRYFWNIYNYYIAQTSFIYYTEDEVDENLMICDAYQSLHNLTDIPKATIYGSYDVKEDKAYAVFMDVLSKDKKWSQKIYGTKYTFTYDDEREVLIFYNGVFYDLCTALGKGLIHVEDLESFYKNHHNCEIEHSYDEGVIMKNEEVVPGAQYYILYTCFDCGHTQTTGVPQMFNFSISFGFDGTYNSKTGRLVDGYNDELNVKCETTLILDELDLLNVYRIFINGNIDKYDGGIIAYEPDLYMEPSYAIRISYEINGIEHNFSIWGACYIGYYLWEEGMDFGYAYHKVLRDYIYSSEEYKSLPPNTNIYC